MDAYIRPGVLLGPGVPGAGPAEASAESSELYSRAGWARWGELRHRCSQIGIDNRLVTHTRFNSLPGVSRQEYSGAWIGPGCARASKGRQAGQKSAQRQTASTKSTLKHAAKSRLKHTGIVKETQTDKSTGTGMDPVQPTQANRIRPRQQASRQTLVRTTHPHACTQTAYLPTASATRTSQY